MSTNLIVGFFMAIIITVIRLVFNFLKTNKRYIDQSGYVRDGFNKLIHRNIAYNYNYASGFSEGKYHLPFQDYIVSHLDGNKLNNHPMNFQLLTREEQMDKDELNKKKESKIVEEENIIFSKKQNNVLLRKEKYNEKIKLLTLKNKKIILKQNREFENHKKNQRLQTIELKEEKEILDKERLTPFTNKQGHRVHINENGYEVFDRDGNLFHKWWFKHKNNRWIKEGYEIHHIDFNKRNNEIDNLEEITPEEHHKKHLERYK